MPRNPLLVAVPTYNEKENIQPLLDLFDEVGMELDILFVDDNSHDGTAELIEEIQKVRSNVFLIKRPGKLGVGSAHRAAVQYAYDQEYGIFATMDADLTHHPRYLRDMLEFLDDCDIVVGSRYLLDSSLAEWNRYRKTLTRCGHLFTSFFLKIPYDSTGGLRLYKLKNIPRGLFSLVRSQGYAFLLESLYILWTNGCQVIEIPIDLPARTYGNSRMSREQIFISIFRLMLLYTNIRIVPDLYRLKKAPSLLATQAKTSDWDRYWGGEPVERASDILFEVLATWFRWIWIRPFLERVMWRTFSRGDRVLHAGCGSGQVDQKLKYWLKIVACDFSPEALRMYSQVNSPHSHCEWGDILSLDYPADSFDGVYNLGVMEHFSEEEIRQALREFYRVLRPGGRVVLFWPPKKSPMNPVLGIYSRLAQKFSTKVKAAAPYPPEISRIQSRQQGEGWLREAGFTPIDFEFSLRDLYTQYAFVAEKPGAPTRQAPASR